MKTKISFEVRLARASDYKVACALFAGLDKHHLVALPKVFKLYRGPARTKKFYMSLVNAVDQQIFLAFTKDRCIGLINIRKLPLPVTPLLKPRSIATIDDFFVEPKFRGLGVGKALFKQATIWAKSKKLRVLQLNVFSINSEAINFYIEEGMSPLNVTYEKQL